MSCTVYIPTADSGCGASHLECRVRVERVEKSSACGKYGIACLMEDYDVIGCDGNLASNCGVVPDAPFENSERESGLTRN